jgi:putative spermidine/putrescine transport system ATP-binding protein
MCVSGYRRYGSVFLIAMSTLKYLVKKNNMNASQNNVSTPQPLVIDSVSKRYVSGSYAVDNLTINVPAGTLLGLLGPSGCGKTTLLRMIAGLIPVSSGSIRIGSTDITHMPVAKRDIGLVFQSYALFPHLTIAENVAFGLQMRKISKADIKIRVEEALAMVRLPGLGGRKPRELSGGQQQRVALARALVIKPRILLLDEPLSNLDAKLRDEMRIEITEIQKNLGITTVFVTHDQTEALTMCDLVGVMSEGSLQQLGTPESVYERPESLFVAQFVGRVNTLSCTVIANGRLQMNGNNFGCISPDGFTGDAKATIRPHRISISPPRNEAFLTNDINALRGAVKRLTYIGDMLVYDIEVAGAVLKVEVATDGNNSYFSIDDTVMCEWSPKDMHVYAVSV